MDKQFWIDAVPYFALLAGALVRMLGAYIVERFRADGPLVFDFFYIRGQIVSAVVLFLGLVFANPDLSGWDWRAALILGIGTALAGYAAADVGRRAQKASYR